MSWISDKPAKDGVTNLTSTRQATAIVLAAKILIPLKLQLQPELQQLLF